MFEADARIKPFWKLEILVEVLSNADDENSLTVLWNAEIFGVQDFSVIFIARIFQIFQHLFKVFSVLFKSQAFDIFNDRILRFFGQ